MLKVFWLKGKHVKVAPGVQIELLALLIAEDTLKYLFVG